MKTYTFGPRGLTLALLACLAATTTAIAPAMAQEEGQGGLSFGLMGFSGDSPYGFTDSGVMPFVDFDSRYVRISGPNADLKLPWISNENIDVALRANFFSGEGYEASDDAILTGMAEREGGIWVGAALDWRTPAVDLSFEALSDTGDSEGSRVRIEASRMFFLGERVTVKPRLGAVWMDGEAVDYFYGVGAGEVTPTRAAYSGSSTVNIEAGVSIGYMLAERHMLMLDISATRLGDGIADSPIVPDDTLTAIGIGYMFRF